MQCKPRMARRAVNIAAPGAQGVTHCKCRKDKEEKFPNLCGNHHELRLLETYLWDRTGSLRMPSSESKNPQGLPKTKLGQQRPPLSLQP